MRLSIRRLVAGALALTVLVAVAATPQLLGDEVAGALSNLGRASPEWLWLAAAAFACGLLAMGSAWRAGLGACGAQVDGADATSRYCVGSLANAFLPGGAGGAVRVALYSQTLPGGDCPERPRRRSRRGLFWSAPQADALWTAGGIAGAVGAARALSLGALVVFAAVVGTFPVWPVFLLVAAFAAAAVVARARIPLRLLQGLRALRPPVVGWVALAMVARVVAAASVVAAFGVDEPLPAALVVVPALALAGLLPLTPGNHGVASAAVAIALHARGLDVETAVAAGIAFGAIETVVSVVAGALGALYLTRPPLPAWSVRLAGAAACVAVVGAIGATVLT